MTDLFLVVIRSPHSLSFEFISFERSVMNMQVNGTYDVIVLLVPLPITTVLALLPEKISSESRLLPCPRVKEGEHLVVFELGRQFGTGPGFIGSNFQVILSTGDSDT
jgi:hypothetical protein